MDFFIPGFRKKPGAFIPFLGQRLEGSTEIIVDFGKLSDAHHAENLFEMLRKSRNSNLLVVFSSLSKNLNQNCNAAAVYVGVRIKLDKDFLSWPLIIQLFISFIDMGFGMSGYIALDMQDGNVVLALYPGFVFFIHSQHAP